MILAATQVIWANPRAGGDACGGRLHNRDGVLAHVARHRDYSSRSNGFYIRAVAYIIDGQHLMVLVMVLGHVGDTHIDCGLLRCLDCKLHNRRPVLGRLAARSARMYQKGYTLLLRLCSSALAFALSL